MSWFRSSSRRTALAMFSTSEPHRHPELIDKTIWDAFEAERPKLVPYAGRFQYGHEALHRAIATRAYQSDSSSKRPVASAVFDTSLPPAPPRSLAPHGPHRPHSDPEDAHAQPSCIDKGSFHISLVGSRARAGDTYNTHR
jgi:hypothetical protein